MHVCDYSDRLKIINGQLVRVVTATPKSKKLAGKKLDVYIEFESGRCQCRNLYTSMCGYRVAFPDEVTSLYRNGCCDFVQKLDHFTEVQKLDAFTYYSRKITEEDIMLICGKYPEFKYVLQKWNATLAKSLDALSIWKEHKDIEFMLSEGYESLALNHSFWRLSQKKRKEVVDFLRAHSECKNLSLADILVILKYKLSIDEFKAYQYFCMVYHKTRYDVYKYLEKIGMASYTGKVLYSDYIKLLKQTTHNAKDDYWKYPKDLQKKHDELRDEVQNLKAIKQAKELKTKQEKYSKAVKKLLNLKLESDGYSVYIPETVEEINEHAKALHQCLVTADYISKVIQKQCLLVFIRKGDTPIATAQVFKDNSIGQFYADELDRSNCLPTDEVRAVMDKWIELKKAA